MFTLNTKLALALIGAVAVPRALGQFITCESYNYEFGNSYPIPSHIVRYAFDNGQTFTCGQDVYNAWDEDCAEMVGNTSWENNYLTCPGNEGGSESAAFWITSDGCYNIESGGNHMYCCGVSESGSGGGTCYPSGFSKKE